MGNNQPKPDAHAFARRLHATLDRIPGCPAVDAGRGVWLAKQFRVSQPTTNGWLHGRYIPTPPRVRVLAEKAGVAYDWLYFGRGAMDATTPAEPVSIELLTSHPVRTESLTLAIQLANEALGRELYLPPAQHAELVTILYDLLEDGLPEARVLHFARRTAAGFTRGDDGTADQSSGAPAGADRPGKAAARASSKRR